jgi:hypothetical protein
MASDCRMAPWPCPADDISVHTCRMQGAAAAMQHGIVPFGQPRMHGCLQGGSCCLDLAVIRCKVWSPQPRCPLWPPLTARHGMAGCARALHSHMPFGTAAGSFVMQSRLSITSCCIMHLVHARPARCRGDGHMNVKGTRPGAIPGAEPRALTSHGLLAADNLLIHIASTCCLCAAFRYFL